MDYIRFGQTGLKVSQLCLGTMSMGSSAWKGWVLDEDDSIPILRRALDLGINFFDMADWYSTGRNEEVVGQNLLRMSARERLVLATKVFYPMSDDPNDRGLSRKHIASAIDRSLARIGTDYVDQEYYGGDIDREIARRAREVAARRGVSAAHVAMAWVAGSPNPNVPVVGAAKTAHLEVAVEALALRLDAAERAFLETPYRPRDEINDQNPVRRPRALHPG